MSLVDEMHLRSVVHDHGAGRLSWTHSGKCVRAQVQVQGAEERGGNERPRAPTCGFTFAEVGVAGFGVVEAALQGISGDSGSISCLLQVRNRTYLTWGVRRVVGGCRCVLVSLACARDDVVTTRQRG